MVVIGGGLAGTVAAVAAAHLGAEVTLVSRAPGATALCPGGVDLVPTRPRRSRGGSETLLRAPAGPTEPRPTLAENLSALLRAEQSHPLAVAGVTADTLVQAAQFLRAHLPAAPLAWKGLDHPPFLLPTETGTLREIDLPPAAAEGGDLSDPEVRGGMRLGIAGLPELPGFDPSFVAGALGERLGQPERFVPLLPAARYGSGSPLHPVALARLIEQDQGELLVTSLAALVRDLGLSHLMLPPVVGLDGSPGLLARLREATGLTCFEALAVSGPCPGLRLLQALHDMADSFGVRRIRGRVTGFELEEPACRITVLQVGLPGGGLLLLAADELVLATGGLYGGGIEWCSDGAGETIFGLPVSPGPGPSSHARPCRRPLPRSLLADPAQPQAAFAAGVRVDPLLRPRPEGDGMRAPVNIRACGGVLCGHDPGARRGGTGVALLTGWLAGRYAAAREGAP